MSKRALTILIAVVVLAGAAAAVIASSINDLDSEPVHTLPAGQVHTGELPSTTDEQPATGGDSMNMDH